MRRAALILRSAPCARVSKDEHGSLRPSFETPRKVCGSSG
jgi:hypothetical protein